MASHFNVTTRGAVLAAGDAAAKLLQGLWDAARERCVSAALALDYKAVPAHFAAFVQTSWPVDVTANMVHMVAASYLAEPSLYEIELVDAKFKPGSVFARACARRGFVVVSMRQKVHFALRLTDGSLRAVPVSGTIAAEDMPAVLRVVSCVLYLMRA